MSEKISFKVKRPEGVKFYGNGETRIHKRLKGLSFEESGHTGFQKELTSEQLSALAKILDIDLSNYYDKTETDKKLSGKVDKKDGKGLSTNDFTDEYQSKIINLLFNGMINESKIDTATSSGLYNVNASETGISSVPEYYYLFVNRESTEAEDYIYQYRFANGSVYQRRSIGADFSDIVPTVEGWTDWNTKADKSTVNSIANITDTHAYIPIKNNTETRCGTINCDYIWIEYFKDTQDDVYNAYVCFTIQDKIPVLLYVDVDEIYKTDFLLCGDDVNSRGAFIPQANTMYEIAFKKVNTNENDEAIIVGRVGRVM